MPTDIPESAKSDLLAMLERIEQSVRLLPYWDKRSVPGGLHVKRQSVLEILDRERTR